MPHPRVGQQGGLVACLDNAIREVDVFAEAHLREAAQLLIDLTAYAHVVGTGIELVERPLLLAAADAARGEERRHGVRDGFLHRRERRVGGVGTAEGGERPTPIPSRGEGGLISFRVGFVSRKRFQTPLPSGGAGGGLLVAACLLLHCLQIPLGQHHVAVEHDEPLALCALGTVVAALARAAVGLHEILQVELVFVFPTDLLAGYLRAIFDDDDFKILYFLPAEALQQFVHFVGTVIDGHND